MNLLGYNIRVYGILLNDKKEVLLSKERQSNISFVKFPGGGHELGESLVDCLHREFMEELGIEISVEKHFYTTDFFQLSAFNQKDQLISIYYKVRSEASDSIENGMISRDFGEADEHSFYWMKLEELKVEELTYPIDRHVVQLLID